MRNWCALAGIALAVQMPSVSAAQTAEQSDEIVVLARKLQAGKLGLKLGRKNGVITLKSCKLASSTGDPEVDLIGCAAVEDCVGRNLAKKRDLQACSNARSWELLDELVERRANSGAGQ